MGVENERKGGLWKVNRGMEGGKGGVVIGGLGEEVGGGGEKVGDGGGEEWDGEEEGEEDRGDGVWDVRNLGFSSVRVGKDANDGGESGMGGCRVIEDF